MGNSLFDGTVFDKFYKERGRKMNSFALNLPTKLGFGKAISMFCLLSIIIIATTACGHSNNNSSAESKPFKDLLTEDVLVATVELLPPNAKVDLSNEEISELVDILQTVEIYEKDDSYREYNGQAVIYNITKADGGQEKIMAYNPFIVINDVGYKTKYEPCEELNALGNPISELQHGKQVD